jgi:hypothetical protein
MLPVLGSNVKSWISRLLFAISVAALSVGVAGSALAASDIETKRRPVVVVTREAPFVVSGRSFRARERVALRAVIGSRVYTRNLRATATGTFRATFEAADAACHPYTVTARGDAGSRAAQTRRFDIPPPCGMEPQP